MRHHHALPRHSYDLHRNKYFIGPVKKPAIFPIPVCFCRIACDAIPTGKIIVIATVILASF